MRALTLYGRPGCHLCELALEEVEPLCRAAGVGLQVLDVDADPELARRYGERIPVLCAEAAELTAWPLDRARILAWLGAA